MISRIILSVTVAAFVAVAMPQAAHADFAKKVGLGIAAGAAYSPTEVRTINRTAVAGHRVGTGFAWGFFVDIPLLETFYITPQTTLYEQDVNSDGRQEQLTDVDLNFKFIVPVGGVRFGAGVTGGLTTGADLLNGKSAMHYGVIGFGSMNLVSNLDAFVMVQYKKLTRSETTSIDGYHGFAGGMYHF